MVGAAVPASLSEAGDGWDRNLPAGVGSGGRRTPVGLAAATVVAPCRALLVGAASILLCFFLQGKASLTSALRCSPTRGKKDETESTANHWKRNATHDLCLDLDTWGPQPRQSASE